MLLISLLLPNLAAAEPILDASGTQLAWNATSPAGATVTLVGTDASTEDPDVVYSWWLDCTTIDCASSGGSVLVTNSADALTADVLLSIGTHNITLWALSGGSWFSAPEIVVTVSDIPATADAGDDQTVSATSVDGAEVTLDGSGSLNAESYAWSIGDTVIGTESELTYEFALGSEEVTLTVLSIGGVPSTDTVTVTVAPVAVAGDDQSVDATSNTGALVNLDGTGSFGSSYSWMVGEDEIANGIAPEDVEFGFGTTVVTLVVSAPGEQTTTDTVSITVSPVAEAGEDQALAAEQDGGALVSLDGSGSFGTEFVWMAGGEEIAEGIAPVPVLLPIGVNEVTLVVTGAEGQTVSDTVEITVSPVADAGGDQTLGTNTDGGANVTLDGTESYGDPANFVWTSDDEEELATGGSPTIFLPVGEHEITLTVTGPGEVSDSDTITIVIEERYLNANATQGDWDATSDEGATVTLDGSLSTIDDDAEFTWWLDCITLDCASHGGTVLVPNSADALVAEADLAIGVYNITLWALVDGVWHQADEIVVNVNPVADAGVDQIVEATNGIDAEVDLDGSASIGDRDSMYWLLGEDEIAVGANPTVTLPVGVHEITAYVPHFDVLVASDTVTIIVAVAPVADAGDDQSVKATSNDGATVSLDGSGSTADGEAEIVSWVWTVDEDEVATGETADVAFPIGTTTVTLTVTDSNGLSGSTSIDVSVTVPAAHAGDDQAVIATSSAGAFVTLDGSASIGDITEWAWSTEENADLATGETVVVLLPLGVHEITLTVTDDEENTDTDTITITVGVPGGDASASVTPARSTVGADAEYAIAFFPIEETVTIELIRDGAAPIAVGTVETDAIGSASGSFAIPAAPGGDVSIHFTSGEVVATADLEIAPRVIVDPAAVQRGANVQVNLTGYSANETVNIRWRVGTNWVSVGTVVTGANGSGNTTVTVPANATAGQNSVRGDGPEFRAQTNAVTVVAPLATLTRTRTTVNVNVGYTVEHFPANAEVTVTFHRPGGSVVALGTVTTDGTGAAIGTFKVPATEGGPNSRITFASGSVSVVLPFEVAPRIKVIPGTVEAGQTVDISLRGFGKNETVRIRWQINGSWVQIATVTTSNTGSANVIISVPAGVELGQNSVRGDGPQFRAQTNAVTVIED